MNRPIVIRYTLGTEHLELATTAAHTVGATRGADIVTIQWVGYLDDHDPGDEDANR